MNMSSGFSADTEVLARDGWVLLGDVCDTSNALVLDLESRRMHNRSVSVVERSPEHLMSFSNVRMSQHVVPTHPLVVQRPTGLHLVPAHKVKKTNGLPLRDFEWTGRDLDFVDLPEVIQNRAQSFGYHTDVVPVRSVEAGDWMEFFGFWLADGCARRGLNSHGKPRYITDIKQSELNEAYVFERYRSIGFEPKIGRNSTGNHNYTVYSKQLWTMLEPFGQSADKYVDRDFLHASPRQLQRLWDGYVFGDSTEAEGRLVLSSLSKQLMDDVQELALKLFGRVFQVTLRHGRQADGRYYPYHGISITFDSRVKQAWYGEPEYVKNDRPVFSVIGPENHAILVRHGDRIGWSGIDAE